MCMCMERRTGGVEGDVQNLVVVAPQRVYAGAAAYIPHLAGAVDGAYKIYMDTSMGSCMDEYSTHNRIITIQYTLHHTHSPYPIHHTSIHMLAHLRCIGPKRS